MKLNFIKNKKFNIIILFSIISVISLIFYFVFLNKYFNKGLIIEQNSMSEKTKENPTTNYNEKIENKKETDLKESIKIEEKASSSQIDYFNNINEIIKSNNPIYFIEDTTEMKEGEKSKLENINASFKAINNIELLLKGHADSVGIPDDEMKLSKDRAELLKEYFIKKNPNISIYIKTEFFGSTQLVYKEKDVDKRYLNRRVEIFLLNAK